MNQNAELLKLEGISKAFGGVYANRDISLTLHEGEVLALLGENGAGKSTLMNIIYGIYRPDAGRIVVKGKETKITSPQKAMRKGIGMVHQHFMLVGRLTAVENVCLMSGRSPFSLQGKKQIKAKLEALKEQYGIEVDLTCPVEQLSISMQQKVEILKLLYTGADILILDEPTAVLLPQECGSLFDIIQHMVDAGKGVIFISHKLDEVLRISDRVDVLSHGCITGQVDTKDADKDLIIRMMSGDDVPDHSDYVKKTHSGRVCLRCEAVEAKDDRKVKTLNGASLTVHAGEIVGVAGVEGNGQAELAEVLAGVRKARRGKVYVGETEMNTKDPAMFIEHGVGYVPSDRNAVGTVADFPLYENWMLRNRSYPTKGGLTDKHALKAQVTEAMERFDVRASGCSERSANLSGGNLQKFILARELTKDPAVLICSYPTRGLDVKAAWFVRDRITKAKERGAGVVLFSGDLDELFTLSDRIVVLYNGRVVAEVRPEETTHADVIMMMMGGSV